MADRVTEGFHRLEQALGDSRATPDLDWVAALADTSVEEARAALAELIAQVPLEERVRRTLRSGGREQYASILAPFELYALTRLLRPAHIVEVGVSSGISSTHFLLALRQNRGGTLHSIDLPTRQRGPSLLPGESAVSLPPGRRTGWGVPPELRDGWELSIGPSQRLLPELVRRLPQVDLFLHDDLHTPEHLAFELRVVAPGLRRGSVVLADNTSWTGEAFQEFAELWGATVVAKRGTDLLGLRIPTNRPRRSSARLPVSSSRG